MATRKNPLFGAAVMKLSFQERTESTGDSYRMVYEGVLRDLGITDEEVEQYLADHREEVERAVRGQKG